ncbi:MAG: endonuclease [Legionella sp.]|nr:MAG: endonuclease [Legionella sp.]
MTHTLDVFKYLHEGALIITPNNRLSLQLLQTYDATYRDQNTLLTKPKCFSYDSFLRHMFHKLRHQTPHHPHPLLLSEHQIRYLWRLVLRQHHVDAISAGLLDVVHEAWVRCQAWQISYDDPTFNDTTHTRRFQRWFKAFQHELTTHNAIATQLIPAYLIHHQIQPPSHSMIWTCFDEFTPIQQQLQRTLEQQNCSQYIDDLQPKDLIAAGYEGLVQCLAAHDEQEEYQQMIAWVDERLAQGAQHIAIVVPDLQAQAHTLQSMFDHHFSPDLYNISYGKALSDFPVVGTALQWLALDLEHVTAHQIRLLLQSPFISSSQKEFIARSQLLQDSSMMKEFELSWPDFLLQIASSAPLLYAALQPLSPYPELDSPSAWTSHFKQRLECMGYPGEGPILSETYQCFHRFIAVLDDVMSLNAVTSVMSAAEAIQALHELTHSVVFQIKKPATPITILGLLEASGCLFDSIWVTGLTDQCLPHKTRFSSWLPISLQKETSMPYTCAQREFERAQMALERLAFACDTIVYSYPKMLNDQPQAACVLIKNHPIFPIKSLTFDVKPIDLIRYDDSYMHPPESLAHLSGGTALLAHQAKCPFQAFAAHRLKARPAPDKADGLDLMERGQVLHRILEMLWKKLGSQAALLAMNSTHLEQTIHTLIQTTLTVFSQTRYSSFSPLAQKVEYDRLKCLVYASLDWEKQRQPFVIESLEQTYLFTLADIPFKVRIDRLDRSLQDRPTKTVIDYKTSLPTTQPWIEERPEAPQLLLYALLDTHINTLLFMQLKTGRMTLSGFSAESMNDRGITSVKAPKTWADHYAYWEQQLTQLASEIKLGHCMPQPKRHSLCQQCAFGALCRIETH